MKIIRTAAILIVSVAVTILFAVNLMRVDAGTPAAFTIDANGDLTILSENGVLTRTRSDGTLVWQHTLPDKSGENELRYVSLVGDRNGAIYVLSQEHKYTIDTTGVVQDAIFKETIYVYSDDGKAQKSVLSVDKDTLTGYSTEPYIQKLQMTGETMTAICRTSGNYDLLRIKPYGDAAPQVFKSYRPSASQDYIEDMTILSDGSFVYSADGGRLFMIDPNGKETKLSPLVGENSAVSGLSVDTKDHIYYTELMGGGFYSLDVANNRIERLYNPKTEMGSENKIYFDQLRRTFCSEDGSFCAVSIASDHPFYVRFGKAELVIKALGRGWDTLLAAKLVGVFAGTAACMIILLWLLSMIGRRSMLTGRILLNYIPVYITVMLALGTVFMSIYMQNLRQMQKESLSAAARVAAGVLDASAVSKATMQADNFEKQHAALQKQMTAAAQYACSISDRDDIGLVFYLLSDDNLYCTHYTNSRDSFFTTMGLVPVAYELDAGTAKAISALKDSGGSVNFFKDAVEYTGCFEPVKNAEGKVVGLIEARAEKSAALGKGQLSAVAYILILPLVAALLTIIWLLLTLTRAFRPLQELGRCIGEISTGNWSVKATITSHDELANIGASFNQMTEKLNQYISNMVLLNNQYIKFIPRELFQLLGKSKVTDLKLYDKSVRDISLLYVNFTAEGSTVDNEAYFQMLNENSDKVFEVVEKNRGIIERFDGSGMFVLFPWQVQDALSTAIALKEILTVDALSGGIKMIISTDETLVGVAGNQKRQTITVISKTVMDIYLINSLMDDIGVRYVLTRQALEKLGENFYFNYREIGSGASGKETLFEFLDGMEPYEKKLHIVTKTEFEKGIKEYQTKHFVQARKHFVNVLQINEKDRVAIYYLMLCDEKLHGPARKNIETVVCD